MSTLVYYASDVHGTERLWRKFLNAGKFFEANVLIMGGDVAGKAVLPIERTEGGYLAPRITGDRLLSEEELEDVETKIRNRGFYPYRVERDELDALRKDPEMVSELFRSVMIEEFGRWLALAEERLSGTGIRLFVMLGNDDEPRLKDVIAASNAAVDSEEGVVEVGESFEMVSCGWSNPTPWASPREMPEERLEAHLESLILKLKDPKLGIFNFHVPPYGTTLDLAPVLDDTLKPVVKAGQVMMGPVGSKAVRAVIEKYQPALGLHGHIHESRGTTKLGRTICINPGSAYSEGVLHGALIELSAGKVQHYRLASG
ncbi:MAG: metallophosphoesterase family protein [Acidimicrobiales bacterium]